MSPNSIDIDPSNPYVFAATPLQSYTVGSAALSLTINQFSTEAICALKSINLVFSLVTLDLSNGNVLTYSSLPIYVTTAFNPLGLSGGSITILSNDLTLASSTFFISVEGTF